MGVLISIHQLSCIYLSLGWQQAKQVVPGLLITDNVFQLNLGDPNAIPGQPRYVILG